MQRNSASAMTSSSHMMRKDTFRYDIREVNYPYYYPDTDLLCEAHATYRVCLPAPFDAGRQGVVDIDHRGGKDVRLYRTYHRDLKFILKRTELRGKIHIRIKIKPRKADVIFYALFQRHQSMYIDNHGHSIDIIACMSAHKYTFTTHDTDTGRHVVHSILWDYETGHVRISPMFKTSEFDALRKKNTPRRCVNRNGLNDCYASITGGNIEAQGFWIPYIAAKAICSKFCFDIRYALSPIFGNDFPSLCEMERREIKSSGKTYGTEETLQIDDWIIQAVKAKQAVVEWQIYFDEGIMRNNREEELPPVEKAWKSYLITCKGLQIPPRLSYPEAPEEKSEVRSEASTTSDAQTQADEDSGPQENAIAEEGAEEQVKAAIILMELRYGQERPWQKSPSPFCVVPQ